jgi:hypothetical protein
VFGCFVARLVLDATVDLEDSPFRAVKSTLFLFLSLSCQWSSGFVFAAEEADARAALDSVRRCALGESGGRVLIVARGRLFGVVVRVWRRCR